MKTRVVDRSADEKLKAATSNSPDTKENTAIRSNEQTLKLKQSDNDLNNSIPPKQDMNLNDENTLEVSFTLQTSYSTNIKH